MRTRIQLQGNGPIKNEAHSTRKKKLSSKRQMLFKKKAEVGSFQIKGDFRDMVTKRNPRLQEMTGTSTRMQTADCTVTSSQKLVTALSVFRDKKTMKHTNSSQMVQRNPRICL